MDTCFQKHPLPNICRRAKSVRLRRQMVATETEKNSLHKGVSCFWLREKGSCILLSICHQMQKKPQYHRYELFLEMYVYRSHALQLPKALFAFQCPLCILWHKHRIHFQKLLEKELKNLISAGASLCHSVQFFFNTFPFWIPTIHSWCKVLFQTERHLKVFWAVSYEKMPQF